MDYEKLLRKFNLLRLENERLKEENRRLKIKLNESPQQVTAAHPDTGPYTDSVEASKPTNIFTSS